MVTDQPLWNTQEWHNLREQAGSECTLGPVLAEVVETAEGRQMSCFDSHFSPDSDVRSWGIVGAQKD